VSIRRLRVAVQAVVDESPPAGAVRRWINAALAGLEPCEVTVRIVGEPESAALNERFRGQRGPTNVLSFPAERGLPVAADEAPPLGDLVVCAPVVAREAAEQGKTAEAHWAHIVVHGALHLAGLDHETESDARLMEDRERRVLAGLGFPDPYRDDAR
jgi:probable rRNA maturation factor